MFGYSSIKKSYGVLSDNKERTKWEIYSHTTIGGRTPSNLTSNMGY